MNVQVTNLYDLQDRRIMMEKKLPPYGYALLLIVAALMIGLVAWSTVTPRIYISQLQGTVQSANKTYIMSSYSGQITELTISEGSYVEQGDLIAHVKSTDIDIQRSQLENQLAIYQTQLDQYNKLIQSIEGYNKQLEQVKENLHVDSVVWVNNSCEGCRSPRRSPRRAFPRNTGSRFRTSRRRMACRSCSRSCIR